MFVTFQVRMMKTMRAGKYRESIHIGLKFDSRVVIINVLRQVLSPKETSATNSRAPYLFARERTLVMNFAQVFGEFALSLKSSIHGTW